MCKIRENSTHTYNPLVGTLARFQFHLFISVVVSPDRCCEVISDWIEATARKNRKKKTYTVPGLQLASLTKFKRRWSVSSSNLSSCPVDATHHAHACKHGACKKP